MDNTHVNMEEMTTAINDAVKNAGLSTAGTINATSSIRHCWNMDTEISQSDSQTYWFASSGKDW